MNLRRGRSWSWLFVTGWLISTPVGQGTYGIGSHIAWLEKTVALWRARQNQQMDTACLQHNTVAYRVKWWPLHWRYGASNVSFSNLVLLACTEDEVVVGHLPVPRHQHILGYPVDAHHLACHHIDTWTQRELGVVSVIVTMAIWRGKRQSVLHNQQQASFVIL